ncbi:hypothetical protein LSTR_LSTR010721 [Laodelphax striatellus]|uniref:Uncharacterized protein n=1 Tax=Laodelphax striatellus TaxID=195883 RepID=A0A482WZ53_LAOST|nr:hypothetical protein LSTR_LSTR010721 [Laodelphax striatellus]
MEKKEIEKNEKKKQEKRKKKEKKKAEHYITLVIMAMLNSIGAAGAMGIISRGGCCKPGGVSRGRNSGAEEAVRAQLIALVVAQLLAGKLIS